MWVVYYVSQVDKVKRQGEKTKLHTFTSPIFRAPLYNFGHSSRPIFWPFSDLKWDNHSLSGDKSL